MRRYPAVALLVAVFALAACDPNPAPRPIPTAAYATWSVRPTPAKVVVPPLPAGDPSEQVLARVPVRGPGGYSAGPFAVGVGHLATYFACTGGGSLVITLESLETYTEDCSADSVTSAENVHDIGTPRSVLVKVEASDTTTWSFMLSFRP